MNKRRRFKAKRRRAWQAYRRKMLPVFGYGWFAANRHEDCDCASCRPWTY